MNSVLKQSGLLAALSAVFPLGYLASFKAGWVQAFPSWGDYLWPTGVLLLAAEGHEADTVFGAAVIAASLASNALIWIAVGLAGLWLLKRLREA